MDNPAGLSAKLAVNRLEIFKLAGVRFRKSSWTFIKVRLKKSSRHFWQKYGLYKVQLDFTKSGWTLRSPAELIKVQLDFKKFCLTFKDDLSRGWSTKKRGGSTPAEPSLLIHCCLVFLQMLDSSDLIYIPCYNLKIKKKQMALCIYVLLISFSFFYCLAGKIKKRGIVKLNAYS